ncbi:hypothetical protein PVAND_016690 [Polypedilum vanderplanki]|uniref:Cytochrome P450 n=1 Tax=Polypedilum vanderplanki TaxID=319348 RepID=A0A9J6BGX1_POLVA|nr:hypothetical protein PVAND_016690 [Polypedilum vanderplanki]
MSLILIILVVTLTSLFAIFRFKYRRFYKLAAKIPKLPGGLPIIGATHIFMTAEPKDYLPIMLDMIKKDMVIGSVWFGTQFAVILNTVEDFQKVLTSPNCINKPKLLFDAFFSDSASFCVNNNPHEMRRKLLNPSFTSLMLNKTNFHTNEAIKGFINKINAKSDGKTIDIYHDIAACALRGTLHAHFDYDDDSLDYKVVKGFDDFKPLIMQRLGKPWLSFKPFFKLSKLSKQVEAVRTPIYECINKIIESNKHHRIKLEGRCVSTIRQLLDTKQKLSDEEIAEEIFIFIYASHETSALALSACLLLLAMHKNVEEKIFEEIKSAKLSEEFTSISNEETQSFPYIEMVIKETMRLFPPVAVTFRETIAEVEVGDYLIPPDTIVGLPVLLIHRNEKIWGKDAGSFRPERFEPEEFNKIPQFAFLPFLLGKRTCIGYKYAMYFMKIFIINFVKNYKVETDLKFDELKTQMTPATSLLQGYPIKIIKRK